MTPTTLKRVAVALGIVLVLWGAAELLSGRSDRLEQTALVGDLSREAADTVSFIGPDDTVRLAKTAQGSWQVNGFAASPTAIDQLFEALTDSAQGELIARSPASHARMGVDTSGVRLQVIAGGAPVVQLVLGDQGPAYRTRYVRPDGDDRVYLVEGRLSEMADRSVDDWRDKRIVSVASDSIAQVAVERGRTRFTVTRRDSTWVFAGGEAVDTAAVRRLVEEAATLEAQGGASPFATPAQVDSADFRRPDRRVTLLGERGDTLAALLFDSTTSGFWVRHDSGGTVYHLPRWRADDIAPADSSLRRE